MPERKLGKLNLPPLSVLVSCFAPWSLTARITTSAQGFPFTSRIVPLIDPVWAPARGASRHSSAAAKIAARDRKSTRLNSSHQIISYAVFCLKKKKKEENSQKCIIPTRYHT